MPGRNVSSQMKESGTSGVEARRTAGMTADLLAVLTKTGKLKLWDRFLSQPGHIKLDIGENIQGIYSNPQEASKDNYRQAIARLEELLNSEDSTIH